MTRGIPNCQSLVVTFNIILAIYRYISVCAECVHFLFSGDVAMVMKAGTMDLRKLAEVNGGGLSQNKIRKYASEMASVLRWVEELRLEDPQQFVIK